MRERVQNAIRAARGALAVLTRRSLPALRLAARERRGFSALCLAAFAAANGLLALWLTACSCASLDPVTVFSAYFAYPRLLVFNLLPPVLLALLGWYLTGRAWAAYLLSAVPTFALALANFYKILLRGDPLVVSDLRLIRTASGIVGHYQPSVSLLAFVLAGGVLLRLLLCVFLLPKAPRGAARARGALVCLTLFLLLCAQVCDSRTPVFPERALPSAEQADAETYVAHGAWFSFLRSIPDALPALPERYSPKTAESILARYEDADIPDGQKVQVVGVMLEAFCDLTDFPALAAQENVAAIYQPLHALESRGVSGDLLTNIFAGGTVDTEWGVLTGYPLHGEFTADLDTYVRYFKSQGYDTVFQHPGYGWFYNRENINRYFGFDRSVFTESGFGELVDPKFAIYRSDGVLFDYLYNELATRPSTAAPLFSFSVTYQNHGPYDATLFDGAAVTPEESGLSEETCGILSHYLYNVENTITEICRFTDELDKLNKPVVLVLFGDHKPWLGNGKSVYTELGVNLAPDTEDGFHNTYSTPYLLWANRAAKRALGKTFTGDGGDFSPCFLLEELFDRCGWDGPAFMQLSRDMRAYSPLLHRSGRFLVDGALRFESELPEDALAFYRDYRSVSYWRETQGLKK